MFIVFEEYQMPMYLMTVIAVKINPHSTAINGSMVIRNIKLLSKVPETCKKRKSFVGCLFMSPWTTKLVLASEGSNTPFLISKHINQL
jgi:hypothetical protein